MRRLLLTLVVGFGVYVSNAQTFEIDADIRERAEYLRGFGTLTLPDAEPGFFVAQRARLNTGYTSDKLNVMVSFQDVSTWGATPQIAATDADDSFSLAQAWAELKMSESWSVKLGRQALVYDDQRILGGLDWAMQGRFHDAALLRYKKKGFKIDAIGAFSNTTQSKVGSVYNLQNAFTYKTMQVLHISNKWNKASISYLFMNNGFQNFTPGNPVVFLPGVYNRVTTGLIFKASPAKILDLSGSAYYQFGKANSTTNMGAYDVLFDATINASDKLSFGAGLELLSGNDATTPEQEAFFPLYGTNHAFNGYMDYFYVGNHANNVGLNDYHVSATFKPGKKTKFIAQAHYFTSNTDIAGLSSKDLGTELDLVVVQPLMKGVVFKGGYSQMFAKDGLRAVKGVPNPSGAQNWAWAMLVIKPTLFTHKIETAPATE
ncbi:MAG: alginate export family protein [Flavobacteriales bacterium]|nr:alginate export family protein [Flavobacteriales bacterium]